MRPVASARAPSPRHGWVRAALVAVVATLTTTARAGDCPDATPKAACMLHDEAVELFTAGRFEEAATKFRAAIAAAPSARSYLGYSQAVEGQGKVALAYETMLVAQQMSNEEMAASGGKDASIVGRADRIKYKLSDLGGRIGFVWLRVPEGVAPQRVVAVHREREGDLPSPLGRWVTVAPNRQLLIASLDDGTQLEVVAVVAAGAQSSLVIPIRAPAPQRPLVAPQRPLVAPQRPLVAPRPPPGTGQPIAQLYEPPPTPPPPPLPSTVFALGVTVLAPGPDALASGTGITGLYERRLGGSSFGLAARFDYVFHPSDLNFDGTATSGTELLALAGARTMSRTIHARIEAGFDVLAVSDGSGLRSDLTTDVYPCVAVGGGLQFGRFRFHTSIFWTIEEGFPVRFMGTLGVELFRR